jgi:hypothetical protein
MKMLSEKQIDEYIENLVEAFDKNDAFELRKMSNDIIELAMTSEDSRIVDLSIIAYTLSKIVLKGHAVENPGWLKFKQTLLRHFKNEQRRDDTTKELQHLLDDVLNHIIDFDQETGNYAVSILDEVRIKQASRLYALGLSLSKSAELTKVNKEDLLNYIGTTKIHDRPFTQSKSLTDRYRKARGILL